MKFEWNDRGICTNPTIFFQHGKGCDRTTISTALDPISGQWFAASCCSFKTTGSSSGVGRNSHWSVGFATEAAAAAHAMQRALTRDTETWYQVNSPQATVAMRLRVNQLTGRIGVQASLF